MGSFSDRSKLIGLILANFTIFIDTLIFNLIVPIIPSFSTNLGASKTIIGFIFGSYAFFLLLSTPFWAIISDRIGRKIPIIIGLIGFILSTLFFAFANNIPELFIARSLQGLASAATWTSCLALLADIYGTSERGKVMGFTLTITSIGSLLGAPLGGFLNDVGGYKFPFLIVTAIVLIILFGFVFIFKTPEKLKSEKVDFLRFLRNPKVLVIAAVVFAANGILSMIEPLLPLHLNKSFNSSSTVIGLLFGLAIISYGVFAPLAGNLSDKFGHAKIMPIGLIFISFSLPFLFLAKSIYMVAAAAIIVGGSVSIALTPTLSAIANITDEEESNAYATAYAIFDIFYGISMVLGPVIGGFLSDLIGLKSSAIYISCLLFAFSLFLILKNRKVSI